MIRKDVTTGVVYAYCAGRLTNAHGNYGNTVRPLVVLSTTVSSYDKNGLHDAPEGRPMRRGTWNAPSAGFPAIILSGPDKAAAALHLWRPEEFSVGRRLDLEDGSEPVGSYVLVTSSGYLHGDYTEVMADRAKANAAREAEQRQRNAWRAKQKETYVDLRTRLSDLGIDIPEGRDYPVQTKLELNWEQAEKLIGLAESFKHFWGNTV